MMPSVFISRSEERAAAFIKAVQPFASRIIAKSLIDFKTIQADTVPDSEWLFFYSQTGADHFFNQHGKEDIAKKNIQVAAFGEKTGAYIQERYHTVDFIGNGTTETTASNFLSTYQPESVCIVRGKTSVNSLHAILHPKCALSEMIVYENSPLTNLSIDRTEILVFTSPMNLESYFGTSSIDKTQKIIVIGSTTALTALTLDINEVHIAKNPSMESLAESTIDLCQSWSDI